MLLVSCSFSLGSCSLGPTSLDTDAEKAYLGVHGVSGGTKYKIQLPTTSQENNGQKTERKSVHLNML